MVKFNSVSKIYKKEIIALRETSFTLERDEFCFVVGPSGAGKSTIARLLIRQELPTEGEIFFEDINVTQIPRKHLSLYRQNLGIVFQDLKLLESKTIRENINFALEIIETPRNEIDETTEYLLDTVGLTERSNLYPEDLSGGEKQRAAIARALANDPKILIADEPTGNLDPETSFQILKLLKAINETGTGLIVITHDKEIVNEMQTRVIHMKEGSIISDAVGGYDLD